MISPRILISCLLYGFIFAFKTNIHVHLTDRDEFIIFNNATKTWKEALESCRNHTAHLVSLESQRKLIDLHMFLFSKDFIESELISADPPYIYWSGGNDLNKPGTYEWEGTEKPFNYTHWLDEQSLNNNGSGCIQFGKSGFGRWSIEDCETKRFYVCERIKD
ncbi:secretory phospholipase A2 receptor-like [Zeugodacus cucurbitae]|uniref:secretory phospholipase A2 receptor-like n=1 Tax=Zeugodacus cucurbitae TaxID=28588 RepID=UPI0023D912A7|nr:secretory phospholipase A2 receptor-like [Zeugodacus cucurbitae]